MEKQKLKPYQEVRIGTKGTRAIVVEERDDGSIQVVYEDTKGEPIAEDVHWVNGKLRFVESGPCGSYAKRNPYLKSFVAALGANKTRR